MAWLYSAGILLIGTGLHTFLKRWTTLGVMALFVMLNFTSSGGIFRPEMQNGFFAALHSFWNGAGFVEGTRSHVYFDGYGLSGHVWTLAWWLVVGLLMAGVAAPGREAAAYRGGEGGGQRRGGGGGCGGGDGAGAGVGSGTAGRRMRSARAAGERGRRRVRRGRGAWMRLRGRIVAGWRSTEAVGVVAGLVGLSVGASRPLRAS